MEKMILEKRGYFWWHEISIPERCFAPEEAVSGVLKINKDGVIKLELDRDLPQQTDSSLKTLEHKEYLIAKGIQGILLDDSEYVLLLGLTQHGSKWSNKRGYTYYSYYLKNCLIGDNPFKCKINALHFNRIEINLTGFEEWLRLGSIEVEINNDSSAISIKHKKLEDIQYHLEEGNIFIKYHVTFNNSQEHSFDVAIRESSSLIYNLNYAVSLEDMEAQYHLFIDLLILLTDSNFPLDWPFISLEDSDEKLKFYFFKMSSSETAPKWYKCPTNFVQLKDNFGAIFVNWQKKRNDFGPGFSLYLGTRRNVNLYIEHRFSSLIWGIESFHRYLDSGSNRSNLEKKVLRIIEEVRKMNIEKEDKKWLLKKLKYAGEPNLEERIFNTLKVLPFNFDQDNLRKFSKKCAEYRNAISHFGGQKQKSDYPEFIYELIKFNDVLSYLYHILLLREIGVEISTLDHWIHKGFKSYTITSALGKFKLLSLPN